jgi:hypothetical protein
MQPRILLSLCIVPLGLTYLSAWAVEKRAAQPQTTAALSVQPPQVPTAFAKGETLAYTALLNELPAGDGEIRLRKERQDEREVYRVTAQARTNELVDFLFRVRGTADGMFAAAGFSPLSFRLVYSEQERPRELGVRYNPTTKTLVGTVKKREQIKERSEPATDVYDPVSAFYLLRSRALIPGTAHQIEVFTGKDRYRLTVQVVRKEDVQLVSGVKAALRLHLEGILLSDSSQKNQLPKETTAWVTPDDSHTPLKLESVLPIGWVVVELREL